MRGNKVHNNFIDSTGGGIYVRYQKELEVFNNIILFSNDSSEWKTNGGGITIDTIKASSDVFDGENTKIYNNTIAHNEGFGIRINHTKGINIYNNLFFNNYKVTDNDPYGHGHVEINIAPSKIDSTIKIDYNAYGGRGCWKWGSGGVSYCSFGSWSTAARDKNSVYDDNILDSDTSYLPGYNSRAKNAGKGLSSEGVGKDYYGNPRPYWDSDFDAGAYEVPDAQMKIGVSGMTSGDTTSITHKINSFSIIYARDTSGNFIESNLSELDSSTYQTAGNSDANNKESWRGWSYKWIYKDEQTASADINGKMGIGFYKISNSHNDTVYFYLDARDAVTTHSPNINILLNVQNNSYYYDDGTNFEPIENKSVLPIWKIHAETPNTLALPSYKENALILIPHRTNPMGIRMAWGQFTSSEPVGYRIRRITADSVESLFQLSSETFDWTDNDFIFGSYLNVNYHVKALRYNSVGLLDEYDSTDTLLVGTNGVNKSTPETGSYSYTLNQNYPNPFNPSTIIRFSLVGEENVELKVFDILGREVKLLINERMKAGDYNFAFNGGGLASGVYIYKLTAGRYSEVKKMQLIK